MSAMPHGVGLPVVFLGAIGSFSFLYIRDSMGADGVIHCWLLLPGSVGTATHLMNNRVPIALYCKIGSLVTFTAIDRRQTAAIAAVTGR